MSKMTLMKRNDLVKAVNLFSDDIDMVTYY